jgi:hypothetical protein
LHIPKTAGTSLREMLMPHFSPEAFCGGLTLSEFLRLSPARLRSFRVITGHFGPLVPRLLADLPLITATVFRDPEANVVSNYRQWRDRGFSGHRWTTLATTLPFEEWCRCEEVKPLWSNPQARALVQERVVKAWPGPADSPEGEWPEIGDEDLRRLSLRYLAQIDIVGSSGDVLRVYQECLERLSIRPTLTSPLRANVSGGRGPAISSDTREWLGAHNSIDAELLRQVGERRSRVPGDR